MKNTRNKIITGCAALALISGAAWAAGVYFQYNELSAYTMRMQTHEQWNAANTFKGTITAELLTANRAYALPDSAGTLAITTDPYTTGNLTVTGILTDTYAPTADSGTTKNAVDVNATAPVDTTGTNALNGVNVDLVIGNASGGTNTVTGVNVSNVTGDAQVNTRGIAIGTGTVLGTSPAIVVGSGWDNILSATQAATADSGATNSGIALALTSPVDTTGTNTHYGINITPTVGNASGGTNTLAGLFFGNITGDAQVNSSAISIGTGTTLGTSNAINIGTGWDAALSIGSPFVTTSTVTGDGGDALGGFKQTLNTVTTSGVTAAMAGNAFLFSGAGVQSLPEASTVLGSRFLFILGTAANGDINPDDADIFLYGGCSAGDALRADAAGEAIEVMAITASEWAVITIQGTWTDVN